MAVAKAVAGEIIAVRRIAEIALCFENLRKIMDSPSFKILVTSTPCTVFLNFYLAANLNVSGFAEERGTFPSFDGSGVAELLPSC
jgi:hypothetical protein